MKLIRCFLLLMLVAGNSARATESWWKTEPVSLIQTNLRETDSDLDPEALVDAIKAFPANTILFSVGGITAHYPTLVENHFRSAYLPEGRDLVGDVVRLAHENDMRVIARFDFSRARKEVYDAHPEWFYTQANGEPIHDDNNLYSICINGGYYHEKALEILTEALTRYPVDGCFFNWFGNLTTDYHGNDIGLCHCGACETAFQQQFGRSIPDAPDGDYRLFMHESKTAVARKFRDLIHGLRPNALFMTYVDGYTDAITAESDYYRHRPLPQWIYSASEHVNRGLNTDTTKMVFNLVMHYQEMTWRFASVPGPGVKAFLYQNMANGAFPAFVNLGTMDQPDMTANHAVRPVFRYYQRHQHDYVGQTNAARVILYARQDHNWSSWNHDYRGFFRILSELHVPFKVTNAVEDITPDDVDLVIVPEGPTPQSLLSYLEQGGSVLIAGTTHPGLGFPPTVRLWQDKKAAYMRIEDHAGFPSLRETKTLYWVGDYLELEPTPTPITLIPPSQFGPPDKVARVEDIRTNKPGLNRQEIGHGTAIFLPWHLGQNYYEVSNDKPRLLISDLIDQLIPNGRRQLITSAHPSVEMTIMEHANGRQDILHLVNLVGHSGTAFFEAVEMRDIEVAIRGHYTRAQHLGEGYGIPVDHDDNGYTRFTIPSLHEYEAIILDRAD